MTDDAEAPDRLYELTAKETIERLRKVIEGQGLSMQAMTRELGEANAKVSELGISLNDARVELERLRYPVGGNLMARARAIYDATPARYAANEALAIQRIACSLQAYGDERTLDANDQIAAAERAITLYVGDLATERARCEQIVDAVRDEQRRIADARVARAVRDVRSQELRVADARVAHVRRILGGLAPADAHSWMTGWG